MTFPRKLLAIALVLLMQGPAMLVQEVAWVKMLATYTQDQGLARALVQTFDGNHPCELCVKASEIRTDEGKKDPAERPNERRLLQLAWAEMVPARLLVLPVVEGNAIVLTRSPWIGFDSGRGTDAPVSPPPEPA
jgi:hypothetical protein